MYRLYCTGTAALDDTDFSTVVESLIQVGAQGKIYTGPVDGVKGNISAYFKKMGTAELAAYCAMGIALRKDVVVETEIEKV